MGHWGHQNMGETAMRDISSHSLDYQLGAYEAIAHCRATAHETGAESSAGGWLKFAAASGATLASAAYADAAITHVMPATPVRVEIPFDAYSEIKFVDLNNDFVNDIQLGALVSVAQTYYGYRYFGSVGGLNGLQMLPDLSVTSNVRRFAANDMIPAVDPGAAPNIVRVSATSLYQLMTTRGNWSADDLGFAGFVFGPAGSKRAGWIQIRTLDFENGRLGAVELVQWAYESLPGIAIKVGQTSSGPIPGDYNNNGSVGPEDYTVWKSTFNNNVTVGTGADGNSNGKVDAADYTVWRDNLDVAGSGSLSASVPEPSTVTLGVLALGATGIAALRRRTAQ